MADLRKRLSTNVSGEFFVDSTCINCDTCRQLAPKVFGEKDGYSMVRRQPETQAEARFALHALLACPTGSIGTVSPNEAKDAISDFPINIAEDVYYCGFNSPKSYGGNSYFIQCPRGNWLIDSPKFQNSLVSKIEELGGLRYIFLTHRDDVAEADRYAKHFGAKRIIHRDELSAQPDAEVVIEGRDVVEVEAGFKIIPTPGHTRGHCVLLYRDKFLFTGDHLAWDPHLKQLEAWEDYSWYSWEEQKQSVVRLLDFDFEYVLPGHGQRVHLAKDEMHSRLRELTESF